MRRTLLVLAVVVSVATIASADFGSASGSFTVTPVGGTLNADFNISVTTTGAATPGYYSGDVFQIIGQLYQTSGGATTTSTWDGTQAWRTATSPSNSFFYSTTLTAPFADTWLWWARFRGTNIYQCDVTTGGVYCLWSTAISDAGSTLIDDTVPTVPPDPNAGGTPVPTLSMPGILLLGILVAGAGILLLRRS